MDEGLIVALVPSDATTGPVTVLSPSGTGTSPTSFVVLPPPPNDRFATPIVLSGSSGSVTNSNVAATKEAGEANHAGNKGGRSIWYQWTAPADGVWRFDTAGSTNDTLLAVYSGPSLTTLTNLVSNDDASAALSTSRVLFPVTKDVTYRIAVDGFNTGDGAAFETSSGTLKLNWAAEALAPQVTALSTNRARVGEVVLLSGVNLANSTNVTFNGVRAVVSVGRRGIYATVPPGNVSGDVIVTTTGGTSKAPVPFTLIVPPANDAFANAKEYGVANGFSGFTNLDATRETGEPLHAESGTNSVWFRWTAPRSGLFVFETVNCSFDTVLAIYTGGAVGSLTKVAEDDDAGALVTSRVLLQATAGVAYSIAIAGAEGAAGSGALRWSEVAGRPVISDFTPLDGGISSWVTILGANFTNVTSVSLGRVKAYYVVDSPGRIRARIPNASTNGILTVVTGMGSASSPGIFRVTDAPGNDDFDSREVITGSYLVWQYNNAKATREEGEPLHAGIPGGKSLWYEWRVPTSGYWAIDTSNTSFDTALAVYTGLNRTNLTLFASNDDFGSRSFSRVEFYAAADTLLEIAIDGFAGAAGEGFLRVQPTVNDIEVVDYDFGVAEGFRTTTSLGGQVGWTATSTRGNGIVTGFFAASPQQAFVGYDGNGVEVKRSLNIIPGGSRPVVRFDVDFAIYDSTNSEYDDFKFRFYNRAGQRLFTLGVSNYYREMYYVPNYDGATTQWLPTKIRNAQIYHLTVVMDFVANRWSAYLDGNDVVLDKYISWNGSQLDLDSVAVVWTPSNASAPGNNYMVFDNYRVTSMAPIRPVVAGLTWSHSITAGAGTVLVAVADGIAVFQYQWYHDGSPVLGGNGPLLWLNHAEVVDAGSYTVRISNGYGTTTSSGIQLTVVPLGLAMESPDTLRVTCAPSQRVRVEVSSDLNTWATVVSQAAGPDGVLRAKTSVGTVSHAFYRVVLE